MIKKRHSVFRAQEMNDALKFGHEMAKKIDHCMIKDQGIDLWGYNVRYGKNRGLYLELPADSDTINFVTRYGYLVKLLKDRRRAVYRVHIPTFVKDIQGNVVPILEIVSVDLIYLSDDEIDLIDGMDVYASGIEWWISKFVNLDEFYKNPTTPISIIDGVRYASISSNDLSLRNLPLVKVPSVGIDVDFNTYFRLEREIYTDPNYLRSNFFYQFYICIDNDPENGVIQGGVRQ